MAMMFENDPTAKQAAPPVEVPPWERAHRLLDQLADEMRARAADIEQQMQRLDGELNAVRLVLSRIAPSPPMAPVPSVGRTADAVGYGPLSNGPFSR